MFMCHETTSYVLIPQCLPVGFPAAGEKMLLFLNGLAARHSDNDRLLIDCVQLDGGRRKVIASHFPLSFHDVVTMYFPLPMFPWFGKRIIWHFIALARLNCRARTLVCSPHVQNRRVVNGHGRVAPGTTPSGVSPAPFAPELDEPEGAIVFSASLMCL